jgi:hypothetical protein
MNLEKRLQEQLHRLKKMGWTLLGLAAVFSGITYFLPHHENIYWLSTEGKEGCYVLSALFIFLGFYCLGAVWRRRNFL